MFINTKLGALLFFCAYIISMPLLSETRNSENGNFWKEIANNRALPPGDCPPGFRPATQPLNPALGCLPNNFYIQLDPNGRLPNIPDGDCPEEWQPVTPPLNPMLICLPGQLTTAPPPEGLQDRDSWWWPDRRHSICPNAWVPVTKRDNKEALICLPKRIAESLPVPVPDNPQGECPDGWKPVTPPLNPVLGCLPNTVVMPQNPDF